MTARDEDWELLGLEPGADLAHIKRAYRERRALYEPAALATYSLLDHEERSDMIGKIDAAYERLLADPSAIGRSAGGATSPRTREAPPAGPPPDVSTHPGRHLRHRRLQAELSLDEISAETKIASSLLEQIENEAYGSLPAPVFVRGHVQQLARVIGIDDPDEIARLYVEKMAGNEDLDDHDS